jgi:hypothetical protein
LDAACCAPAAILIHNSILFYPRSTPGRVIAIFRSKGARLTHLRRRAGSAGGWRFRAFLSPDFVKVRLSGR